MGRDSDDNIVNVAQIRGIGASFFCNAGILTFSFFCDTMGQKKLAARFLKEELDDEDLYAVLF